MHHVNLFTVPAENNRDSMCHLVSRLNSPQAANPVVQTASYRIYFRANVYYETSMKETGLQWAHFCKIAASHSYSFPAAFFGCGRFRHLIPPHRRLALGRKKDIPSFQRKCSFCDS